MEPAKRPSVTIGIVTALGIEFAAVRHLLLDKSTEQVQGDQNEYLCGALPSKDEASPHRVALTVLPRDGTRSAAAVSTDLLRSFGETTCVIMCGIAGGIPNLTEPERHVRLGDIVVASDGIVDYGHVRTLDGVDSIRRHQQGMSTVLATALQVLRANEADGIRGWESWLRPDHPDIPARFHRPSESTDVLYQGREPIAHPPRRRSGHVKGLPRVHYGAVASADRLLRDAVLRDRLAAEHNVRAVEMEGSGIATGADLHSRHWFMVRGVSDYADNSKNKLWQGYAALAAAAFTRDLLAHTPPLAPVNGSGGSNGSSASNASIAFNGTAPSNGSGGPLAAPDTIRREWVDGILQVPGIEDRDARESVVRLLPSPIRDTIGLTGVPRRDVVLILLACLAHDRGFQHLVDALGITFGDSPKLTIVADLLLNRPDER